MSLEPNQAGARGTYLHQSGVRCPVRVLNATPDSETPFHVVWFEPAGELSGGGWYSSLPDAMAAAEQLNPGVKWQHESDS